MNAQIKQVITEYIQRTKMIVKRKGKIEKKPAGKEIPNVGPIMDIPDSKIINDGRLIIQMKRAMKSIRIDNDP